MIPVKYPVLLFFIMFVYSGCNKIANYPKKIKGLVKHTGNHLPNAIVHMGMIGVIILEILGSLAIVSYFWGIKLPRQFIIYTIYTFLLFLIVVTFMYHPPTDKLIPFLSNVTTFGGLLLIYNLIK